jgi:hypothetical protein
MNRGATVLLDGRFGGTCINVCQGRRRRQRRSIEQIASRAPCFLLRREVGQLAVYKDRRDIGQRK